jgi:hypothetical protein
LEQQLPQQAFHHDSTGDKLPPLGGLLARNDYDLKMRNRLILLGYLALFFALVSVYDLYKGNVYLVALVAVILTFAGLAAWLWSVQTGKDKN